MRYENNSGIAILVVDSDRDFTNSIKRYLASLGFDVSISNTREQAIELLKRKNFDILLTGKKMGQKMSETAKNHSRGTCMLGENMNDEESMDEAVRNLRYVTESRRKIFENIRGIERMVDEIIRLYERQFNRACQGDPHIDISSMIESRVSRLGQDASRMIVAENVAAWMHKGADKETVNTDYLYLYLKKAYDEIVNIIVKVIECRDAYTEGHSRRVSDLAGDLARELGLDETMIARIRLGGMLHDVGKIGIPDDVLQKKGSLTEEEYEDIKQHTVIGTEILSKVSIFSDIIPMIRHHHEKIDGSGYPDGLTGNEIPMEARVLSIADAYDAMTMDRAYRSGKSRKAAIEELIKGSGSQFDKNLVKVFIHGIERGRIDNKYRK